MLTCLHMKPNYSNFVWFSGRGTEHFRVCPECAAKFPHPPAELIEASPALAECFDYLGACQGVCGSPDFPTRVTSLHIVHEDFPALLPAEIRIIDIVPDRSNGEGWFCLAESGSLFRLDIHRGVATKVCRIVDHGFEIDSDTALSYSSQGDYAVICQSFGRFGVLVDLRTGAVTCRLDRGDNDTEHTTFSVSLFQSEGRTLVVSATDWNRLDVIDPATGRILSARIPNPDKKDDYGRPEHDLDYYHAQLIVSPDDQWIVDNGWVWHPYGIIRSWNLQTWTNQNAWESEDGASVREFAFRDGYWDGPICWIDNTTVAVWGWGSGWRCLVPAVRIFDVTSGEELRSFFGPKTRPAAEYPRKMVPPSLFFDEYLFSVSDESGTAVWDITTGERLLCDESFAPVNYHPDTKEFLTLRSDGFRLSRIAH